MADSSTSSGVAQESMEKPEFPSGLLGDSMQLQGTAAPFADLASDDESQWTSGGPSRSTRESSTNEPGRSSPSTNTPHAGRLSAILQKLGTARSDSPERKTPQLFRSRSMASSDISQSDESPSKSFGSSVKNIINSGRKRLLSQDGSNVETPKAGGGTSRIPVSGGRKGSRPSLDVTPGANDRTSRPVSSASEAQNEGEPGNPFSSRAKQLDLQSSPTSDVGGQNTEDAGHRYSSKPDNLNESVVDLSSPTFPTSQGEESDAFTDGVPGVRASFLRSGSTRPLAQVDRDFAEISFPSAEVESSTPIKRKGEKQLELERGWMNSGSRSTSPEPSNGFGRRSTSPTREGSWSQGRQLERTNSVASDGSRPGTPNSELRSILLNPRTRGDSTHSAMSVERRSPSPESPRARTMSTPTSTEYLDERERAWNRRSSRPETPPVPRATNRPISTHSLDGAVLNLRASGSKSPQLGRSQSARDNSRPSSMFGSSSRRGVSIDDIPETASDTENKRRSASPSRSQWVMKYIVPPKPSLGPAFTTTPKNSPPRQNATVAIQSTTPNESPPRRSGPPQEVVTPSKRPFHQYSNEPPSPSPPRGGLPPLPALSDDERDSPLRGGADGLSRYGSSRSSTSRTPRAPGGWVSTPARPSSYPPFDDREHPKGTMTPKSDMSDSETASILRPSSPSRQDPRTPAPPGRWVNTPQPTLSQRGSMRKVRFDRTSPNQLRTNSLPTTPDAVVDDAHKILRDLSGLDDGLERTVNIGRKSARMVDEYGRELLFAHDGTPITRRDERSRTTSMESGMSFAPIFPGAMPVDTSKRRSTTTRIRMVDEMGDDITPGDPGLINLASPVDGLGGAQQLESFAISGHLNGARRKDGSVAHSEYSDDDTGLPHQERTQRIRKALDRIKSDVGNKSEDSTTQGSHGRSSRLQDVLGISDRARLERDRLQQEMSKIPTRDLFHGSPVPSKRSGVPRSGRSNWMVNLLLLTVGIATFGVLVDVAGRWYSHHLFLTTYHDPHFAGFHDFGNPHAPTASQWLMLGNHHPSPVKMFTEWTMECIRKIPGLGGLSYYAPIRPSFVPT